MIEINKNYKFCEWRGKKRDLLERAKKQQETAHFEI